MIRFPIPSFAACLTVLSLMPIEAAAREGSLIVFDSSGSMSYGPAQGVQCSGNGCGSVRSHATDVIPPASTRFDHAKVIAKDVARDFAQKNYPVALLVFGQGGCDHIDLSVPFGMPSPQTTISRVLDSIKPFDSTPIAASLLKAAEILQKNGFVGGEVTLITDGFENCNGNAAAAASKLNSKGFKVNVIGLDASHSLDKALREIATAGGGAYRRVDAVGNGGDTIEAGGSAEVSFAPPPKGANLPPMLNLPSPPIAPFNGTLVSPRY